MITSPSAACTSDGCSPRPIRSVLISVSTTAPATVPRNEPRPPTSAVPPMTTAAIVWNR